MNKVTDDAITGVINSISEIFPDRHISISPKFDKFAHRKEISKSWELYIAGCLPATMHFKTWDALCAYVRSLDENSAKEQIFIDN